MRKILVAGVSALLVGGAVAATSTVPAVAQMSMHQGFQGGSRMQSFRGGGFRHEFRDRDRDVFFFGAPGFFDNDFDDCGWHWAWSWRFHRWIRVSDCDFF